MIRWHESTCIGRASFETYTLCHRYRVHQGPSGKTYVCDKRAKHMYVKKRPKHMYVKKRAKYMYVKKTCEHIYVKKRAKHMYVKKWAKCMYVKNMQDPTLIFSEEKTTTVLVILLHILPDWLEGCNFGRGRPNT